MKPTTYVYVKTSFIGYHRWQDAPDEVAFLHFWHRHVFHVKLFVEVGHLNRDVEFFTLQNELNDYLTSRWADKQFEQSCEQLAFATGAWAAGKYKVLACEVSEDGENGAVVFFEEEKPSVPIQHHFMEGE